MSYTLEEILAPNTIISAVSQMELPGAALQNLFGWGLSGGNRSQLSGRHFGYDVFDNTRQVATARGPGQAASRQAVQPIGHVQGTFPRAAEVIPLLDEDLLNRRGLGGPSDSLDRGGETFITQQEAYLAQRFVNLIEFQTAAMLRGSYTYRQEGDDLYHAFEGEGLTVDFQVPAGNRGQLDMLGEGDILDADWSDAETDIPLHLQNINAALVQLTGWGLSHVVLSGVAWQHVINNTKVKALGGSTNVVFETMQRAGPGEFSAVLRAAPWITFHIIDYGLEIWDGTQTKFTKLVADDHAAFLPQPSARWVQYLEGSEIVTEGPGGSKAERFGFYPYAYTTHDPSGWELAAVMNGIPALYTPAAIAYGQITGGVY